MVIPKPKPTIPFTADAFAKLQTEKQRLTALRVEVMARLKEAREQGDLSENGAYTYAKFELGSIGRQLRALNHQLDNGFIATTPTTTSSTIQFGSTVTLQHTTTNATMTFMLVSQFESDPAHQKLSTTSPIGQAILGKKTGDTVTVNLPKGETTYSIITVA